MVKEKVYAVYKGDEFIDVGTAKELASRLGCSNKDIHVMYYRYKKPRNKVKPDTKEMIAIVIDEEE